MNWRRTLAVVVSLTLYAGASASAAEQPLDLTDPTPRTIFVALENSAEVSIVGQSFGPSLPASYSASGGIGTVLISAATHELLREFFLPPVPESFSSIVIEINLNTLEAVTQGASGAFANPPLFLSFSRSALSTQGLAGFISHPDVPSSIFCSSQAELDELCLVVPLLCGAICVFLPGAPYDSATGKLNLVGSETQNGCDGGVCFPEIDVLTEQGDLRLTESVATPVPVLGPGMLTLVALLFASAGGWLLRRTV